MRLKTAISVLFFFAMGTVTLLSQTYNMPNVALKSHETLILTRIEMSAEKTVVYLTIENRIDGGYFCADKNIYIIYPDGTRSKLNMASGIPVCPDTYKFKS